MVEAEEYLLRLLAARDYSSKELLLKLKRRGVCEEESLLLIEKMRDKGFVDDARYSERFIEADLKRLRGPRLIEARLRAKGLSGQVDCDQEEQIMTLLRKRLTNKDLSNQKERAKAFAALLRRGFSGEKIRNCLEKIIGDTIELVE